MKKFEQIPTKIAFFHIILLCSNRFNFIIFEFSEQFYMEMIFQQS